MNQSKIISEYDQEIPHSQTADKPMHTNYYFYLDLAKKNQL